jgi:hypothetical protein
MHCLIHTLREWQELVGATLGGLLGVFGALIVAGSVKNRELRTASRMLQKDLLNVTGMVYSLTSHRKTTLDSLDPEKLATDLAFFHHHLSPMFEGQMAVILGADRFVAGLLIGFHQSYSTLESHVRKIEDALRRNLVIPERERDALPRTLQLADNYAKGSIYVLQPHEMGLIGRLRDRFRRRFRPSQEDSDMAALVQRLMRAEDPVR